MIITNEEQKSSFCIYNQIETKKANITMKEGNIFLILLDKMSKQFFLSTQHKRPFT